MECSAAMMTTTFGCSVVITVSLARSEVWAMAERAEFRTPVGIYIYISGWWFGT